MELKPGDLLFVKGAELHKASGNITRLAITSLIARITDSPYTHVGIYDGKGIIDIDILRTVEERPIGLYSHYDIYTIRDATYKQRNQVVQFAREQIGKKYDYTAIAGIFLERTIGTTMNIQDPNRWYCSELATAAWRDAGIALTLKGGRIAPGDLAPSDKLTRIREWRANRDRNHVEV